MISVFDEQWFRMPPLEYADKLQANNVSDVYPLVWSTHWVGDGPSTTWEHKEEFPDFLCILVVCKDYKAVLYQINKERKDYCID